MLAILRVSVAPEHLRGYLGRFLVEIAPGLFVGTATPRVIEGVWRRTLEAIGDGNAALVLPDPTVEQGCHIRTQGVGATRLADLDGLTLATIPDPPESIRSRASPQVS